MNPIIIIPTRLASTRLPAKALADIGGKPMIAHVVQRALDAAFAPVVVAAGDQAIADALEGMDVRVVLTSPALASGSDRVHAALEEIDPHGEFDVIVNLQGDLPLFDPAHTRIVLRPVQERGFDLGTLVAPVQSAEEGEALSVVKAVCAFDEGEDVARALYFSRAVAPWGEGPLWHHVGVYGWRRDALARFVNLPPSLLERRESLEQLRALEAGMTVGCTRIDHAPLGVDTPGDLERVRELVRV